MLEPLKRHIAFQPYSMEHHHGQLLCWKIKMGLRNKIELHRIKVYADWFFHIHLLPHFDMEEKFIFPILGNHNKFVQQAIADHKRIKTLFMMDGGSEQNLNLIGLELDHHIRFEERILFDKIQRIATEEQLQLLDDIHREVPDADEWEDKFWE